jgi:prevent-host-death family protein
MSDQRQRTERRDSAELQTHWGEVLAEVCRDGTRVVIERDGVPVAALISAEDLRRFEHFERERERRFEALDRSWAAFEGVPFDEIEAEVAKAVAEVRAELQAQQR